MKKKNPVIKPFRFLFKPKKEGRELKKKTNQRSRECVMESLFFSLAGAEDDAIRPSPLWSSMFLPSQALDQLELTRFSMIFLMIVAPLASEAFRIC